MKEKDEAHQGDDRELLEELPLQVLDCPLDEARAVIGGDELNAPREARLERGEFGFHGGDGLERVLARAHDDDASGNLTLAIELGDATAHLGSELHPRHIA